PGRWAPTRRSAARAVDVVFARPRRGYIANDGTGIDPARPVIPLARQAGGIWESAPQPGFARFEGAPYMYRIKTAQGETKYRTDIFSRWQVGQGDFDPNGDPLPPNVTNAMLDGTVSCSLVVDPDTIRRSFVPDSPTPGTHVPVEEFWAREFTPGTATERRGIRTNRASCSVRRLTSPVRNRSWSSTSRTRGWS
ncbi:MAG TPA: hypothetical protein VHF67_09775, partial [Gaiellaceae bacterium]|nr:hypothetical protein [Gaiellaceae bacterium]